MKNDPFQAVLDQYNKHRQTPQSNFDSKNKTVVIIDAGHGGLNSRCEYVTAPAKMKKHKDGFTFLEGVWTRAIAVTFAAELHNSGRSYSVITKGFLDNPLSDRVQAVGAVARYLQDLGKKCYLVCLHGNAFGLESVNGIEVFTSPGQTKSDPIATIYLNELEKLGWKMRLGMGDGDPDKEAKFTMLTGPEKLGVPAILPEIGFYSNYEQALEMCKPQVMDQIALLLRNADARVDQLNLLG